MTEFNFFARLFIFIGIFFTLLGLAFLVGGKIPFLGKLPGDLLLERKNFTFYFPFATCALLSVILSLLLWLFQGFFKR